MNNNSIVFVTEFFFFFNILNLIVINDKNKIGYPVKVINKNSFKIN